MIPPTSIDGTDITGATIDGTDVQEITVDGDVVFSAGPGLPANTIAQYNALDDGQSTGSITTVPDQFANLDLTGTASLVSSGINGKQSYEFNGTTDEVERNFSTPFTQPFTVIAVGEVKDKNEAYTLFTGFSGRTELFFNAFTDNWSMFAGGAEVKGGPGDTIAVLTAAFDGANSFLRVNGTQVDSGNVGSNDPGGVILGYNKTFNTRYLNGYIGEVLIIDGVPSSQIISDEETRIANAYNITI